jgi:hypothetical protein
VTPPSKEGAPNANGLINPGLPLLAYRGNQGKANYHALTATLRIDTRRVRGQVAYTWSHSIDLQSDPLAGAFFSFNFFNAQRTGDRVLGSFRRQFDSQGDRASSDYDQRHNLVFYGVAQLPSPPSGARVWRTLDNWQVGWMGAIRSGFPYTVFANPGDYLQYGVEYLYNNPADLDARPAGRGGPAPGGRMLLNESSFTTPAVGAVGNSGRNGFRGPGVVSLDVSLARSFAARRWERVRLTVRGDAYNLLNHANLNNPLAATLGVSGFGIGYYGRQEKNSGFPLSVPFNESARTVQVLLRLQF